MAQTELTVPLGPMPKTLEDFLALRDRVATSPEGGAAMFALALLAYANDPERNVPFITVSIWMSLLDADPGGYQGKRPRRALLDALHDRVAKAPHIARSYFLGTSPESGYAIAPDAQLEVGVRLQPDSFPTASTARLFVRSSGADSPRPITLTKNDKGLWKANSWSSLEVGVRPPASSVVDDL